MEKLINQPARLFVKGFLYLFSAFCKYNCQVVFAFYTLTQLCFLLLSKILSQISNSR
jgi:hypothetical protein